MATIASSRPSDFGDEGLAFRTRQALGATVGRRHALAVVNQCVDTARSLIFVNVPVDLAGKRLAHDTMALAFQDATVSAGRTASP